MICSSCSNEFLQPFVCTTCGVQKLRDETVKVLENENAALQKDAEKYRWIQDKQWFVYGPDKDLDAATQTKEWKWRLVTPMIEFKRREWVGLTGTEINHIFAANTGYPERMMQAVETLLKEKNT